MPHVPPPLIGLAAGVLQRRLGTGSRPGVLRKAGAGGVAAASVWLLAGSLGAFRSSGTTVNPLDPARASTLVTSGPNAVTRNPMYAGMAGLLVAHGLIRGGWRTALPVAAFVGVIDRIQIRPEEAALRERFGADFETYRQRARRWI